MDTVSPQQRDLLALCALRVGKSSINPSLIARSCQSTDGLQLALDGTFAEESTVAKKARQILQEGLNGLDEARRRVEAELAAAAGVDARLVTVLDEGYPANLRLVPNLPPFLFYRGTLEEGDARSVAVVGTRSASPVGLRRAAKMARGLVEHDVVVFSGLAKGVDTAAHVATMEAGGRTIAVMGTGIAAPYFPAENRPLAQRIIDQGGALLSQFWPTSSPARWTFPQRNVVTSGATMGSIVIEASSSSGARLQAQIAVEHGKQVFLLKSLATREEWAAEMIHAGRAVEVAELEDVLSRLGSADLVQQASQQRIQLALADL